MTDYIDAIIHISDVPALVGFFAQNDPGRVNDQGTGLAGFDGTPMVMNGIAALTYIRITVEDAALYRAAAPGVTILAEVTFAGDPATSANAVYTALFDDSDAVTLYDAVYDRTPRDVDDGNGGTVQLAPPDRFGVMG